MASLPSYTRKRRLVTVTKFYFKYWLCLHPWVIHMNFSGQNVVFHYLSLFTQSTSSGQSKLGSLLLWPFIHSNSLAGYQERYTMTKRTWRERDLVNSTRQALPMNEAASWTKSAWESYRFLPHTTNNPMKVPVQYLFISLEANSTMHLMRPSPWQQLPTTYRLPQKLLTVGTAQGNNWQLFEGNRSSYLFPNLLSVLFSSWLHFPAFLSNAWD